MDAPHLLRQADQGTGTWLCGHILDWITLALTERQTDAGFCRSSRANWLIFECLSSHKAGKKLVIHCPLYPSHAGDPGSRNSFILVCCGWWVLPWWLKSTPYRVSRLGSRRAVLGLALRAWAL